MDLIREVTRYIKHKVVLANVSNHYLNFQRLQSLQYCDSLRQLFCRQQQYLSKQDVARFVLQNKNHLFAILPAEGNKSYKSSLDKYNAILTYSQEILKPKQ